MRIRANITATSVIAALSIIAGCTDNKRPGCIMPDETVVKPGDVAFRKGTGVASHAVTLADEDADYSHCGIVVTCGGKAMVVHAVPDEPDFDGDKDRVKMEPVSEFFSTIKASKGCIMRFTNSTTANRSATAAMETYLRGTLFDHDYDDKDTTKLYCSELVEHVYRKNGVALSGGSRHDINLPGLKFRHVIFPSDFLKSGKLAHVCSF